MYNLNGLQVLSGATSSDKETNKKAKLKENSGELRRNHLQNHFLWGSLVTSPSVLVVTVACTNSALSFPEDA